MIWYAPIVLYSALACATVVPPPGQPVPPTTTKVTAPPKPGTLPAPSWDFLKICTFLNEKGVQEHPNLNPPPYY